MIAAPTRDSEHGVTVSFVVITRNEEQRIARCLESVVRASHSFDSSEIILVDSRSTDSTVKIAQMFPIGILVLSPSQPCSPAAGFTVGTRCSTGTYIVYVGGDMTLNAQWVMAAVDFMNENEGYAVLSGRLLEPRAEGSAVFDSPPDAHDSAEPDSARLHVTSSRRFFGPALVRREHLEQTGGWNPYLTGDEEEELSYRMRARGFHIGTTSEVMAVHLNPTTLTFRETIRRFASGYSKGQGKVLKASFRQGRKAFSHHLWRLKLYVACDVWLAVVVTLVVLFFLDGDRLPMLLLAWIVLGLAGMLALAVQHGFRGILQRVVSYIFLGFGIVQGLLQRLPDSEEFPKDAIRIK